MDAISNGCSDDEVICGVDGKCVNLLDDLAHCGSCSNSCAKDEICLYASCSKIMSDLDKVDSPMEFYSGDKTLMCYREVDEDSQPINCRIERFFGSTP